MTDIGLTFFVAYVVTVCFALYANRDVFSPTKWFLLTLGVFFADLFFAVYIAEIYFVYGCILALLWVFIVVESRVRPAVSLTRIKVEHTYTARLHMIFLVLLSPAIIAQIYLVQLFGGLQSYVNMLGMRVIEFRGLGPITTIKNTYFMITVIYFLFVITKRRKTTLDLVLFTTAFGGLVLLGLMSGSRGTLLQPLVFMLVAYHYMRRPISLKGAGLALTFLLMAAAVLDVARSGYRMVDGTITTGVSEGRVTSFAFTNYGLLPLDLVLREQDRNLYYGQTFFTVFTNFVPRRVWPGKPDTGGVVLTKEYTGDAWDGASNLSTGIITENVINFGYAGIFSGFVMLIAFMAISVWYYRRMLVRVANEPHVLSAGFCFVYYFTVMRVLPSLLIAEFTAALMTMVLQLIVIWLVHQFLRWTVGIRFGGRGRSIAAHRALGSSHSGRRRVRSEDPGVGDPAVS
jgi:oligosaccharide repeat unit polymerase